MILIKPDEKIQKSNRKKHMYQKELQPSIGNKQRSN